MQLRTMEAGPAYNAFLLLRGSKALSRFASGQHQALVRLLCLSTAYVHESRGLRLQFRILESSFMALHL
eukprot:s1401_g2.t1